MNIELEFDYTSFTKFYGSNRLYSRLDTHETILAVWASSSKHSDVEFRYSDFEKDKLAPSTSQIVPWIYECASKICNVWHSVCLAEYGTGIYNDYMHNLHQLEKRGVDVFEFLSVFNKY